MGFILTKRILHYIFEYEVEYQFLLTSQLSADKILTLVKTELEKMEAWKTTGASNSALNGLMDHATGTTIDVNAGSYIHWKGKRCSVITSNPH